MITVEGLKNFGVDTKTGLARCLNKEDFYLKMVGMALNEPRFEQLGAAIESRDMDKAFELSHALKGVVGNLALEPLYKPISEMTELLRTKNEADYCGMYKSIMEIRAELLAL
jgi:HPt (histidine-containing phosphotransfer) domain-containing protein